MKKEWLNAINKNEENELSTWIYNFILQKL
jgi:hypothetical protein